MIAEVFGAAAVSSLASNTYDPAVTRSLSIRWTPSKDSGVQSDENVEQDARGDAGILGGDCLARRMADAAIAAAHEHHGEIGEAVEHYRVVAGAAREGARCDGGAGEGGRPLALPARDADPAALRDSLHLGEDIGDRCVAHGIVAGANVEGEFAAARNDVDGG